jgi:hypothetical protein
LKRWDRKSHLELQRRWVQDEVAIVRMMIYTLLIRISDQNLVLQREVRRAEMKAGR